MLVLLSYLVSEGPGSSDTLLYILDQPVAGLECRVVVERGPDLSADLLEHGQLTRANQAKINLVQSWKPTQDRREFLASFGYTV